MRILRDLGGRGGWGVGQTHPFGEVDSHVTGRAASDIRRSWMRCCGKQFRGPLEEHPSGKCPVLT